MFFQLRAKVALSRLQNFYWFSEYYTAAFGTTMIAGLIFSESEKRQLSVEPAGCYSRQSSQSLIHLIVGHLEPCTKLLLEGDVLLSNGSLRSSGAQEGSKNLTTTQGPQKSRKSETQRNQKCHQMCFSNVKVKIEDVDQVLPE